MLNRLQIIVTIAMVIAAGTMVTSCKHERPDEEPKAVEAGIDGVAVRPMPEMDVALAERIPREGPVSATTDITGAEDADAEVVRELVDVGTESMTTSRYDPNS